MMSFQIKLGLALAVAGAFLFGATLPATWLAVAFFDPLFVSAARAVVAGCLGLAVLLALQRPWPSRKIFVELFAAGLCTIVGYPILIAFALTTVPASHSGVVLGIVPLATMAAAALLLRERPSLGFWLASAAGSLIVVAFVVRHNEGVTISPGDLFLIGAVIAGALGYTFSGQLSAKMPGWEVISWQVVMFLPLTVPVTLLLWPHNIVQAPVSAWAGLAYVSCVSMYLGFFCLQRRDGNGGRGPCRPSDAAAAFHHCGAVNPGQWREVRAGNTGLRRGGCYHRRGRPTHAREAPAAEIIRKSGAAKGAQFNPNCGQIISCRPRSPLRPQHRPS